MIVTMPGGVITYQWFDAMQYRYALTKIVTHLALNSIHCLILWLSMKWYIIVSSYYSCLMKPRYITWRHKSGAIDLSNR